MEGLMDEMFDGSFGSIEWTEKNCTLSSFLDQHGRTLPHVVKVAEGFCGLAASCTIDCGQILILHSLNKETKILAKDTKDYDLFIPRNFQVKVEIVPKNSFEEYSTIHDLLRTFPNYFRVLDDIPSLDITSDSIFQISRQKTCTNYIECLQVGREETEEKKKFLLNLRGRFQPLQDSREFFLDEVLSDDNSPVTVHFVKSSVCTQGNNKVALNELGNIRLIGECETESVFATVLNSNGKTLAVFPNNLNITVKHAVLGNENYDKLREDIMIHQNKANRRISRLNKLVLYQARNPVRQFPFIDILPPICPKPRTQSLLDRCTQGNDEVPISKERSNSTPPLPTAQPPQRSKTMKNLPKTTQGVKKPLRESFSVPMLQNKTKLSHKPPPTPPHPRAPLLPPRDKLKPRLSEEDPSQSPKGDPLDGPSSPTNVTPTPPPRRKRKKKIPEITEEIVDDQGYVRMNSDEEMNVVGEYEQMTPPCLNGVDKVNPIQEKRRCLKEAELIGGAYEQMDLPFLSEKELEQTNASCLSNEKHGGDVYEQMGPPFLNQKTPETQTQEDDSTKTLEELFGVVDGGVGKKGNVPIDGMDYNHNTLQADNTDTASHDYYNMKTLDLTKASEEESDDYEIAIEHRERVTNITNESTDDSTPHDYYNMINLDLTKGGEQNSQGIINTKERKTQSPTNTSTENVKHHDYYNMKNLDLKNVQEGIDVHDYENTKPFDVPGKKRESGDGDGHDYENTKEFDMSTLPRQSSLGTDKSPDKDTEVKTGSVEARNKKSAFAYENTGHLNRELPVPHRTPETSNEDEIISTNQLNESSSKDASYTKVYDVDTPQTSTTDEDYENTACFNLKQESEAQSASCINNKSLTRTEQLVNQLTQRRLSPIGMEDDMLNEEDQYTNMDETNIGETKHDQSFQKQNDDGQCYESMLVNSLDQTFHNKTDDGQCYESMLVNSLDQTFLHEQNDGECYVPMNESMLDSSIYENESSDHEAAYHSDSCYEEIDMPISQSEKNRPPGDRMEADGSPNDSDSEELHYHQVDLSSLALSLEEQGLNEDIYEDIDTPLISPDKSLPFLHRPTPPSRRTRPREGEFSDGNAFKTPFSSSLTMPPTSPPRKLDNTVTPPTSPPRKLDNNSTTLPTSPPSKLANSTPKSSEFEYIDNIQLHLAIRDSLKTIKKANKSRPPAPPPKKLNYVKVEPLAGEKPPKLMKTPKTNYSSIVGTEKPGHVTKTADEMEYIDDCELHLLERDTFKKEKRRKEELKKQAEIDASNKVEKIISVGKNTKYGSPSSRDFKEPMEKELPYINKIRENESRDTNKPIQKETSDLKTPIANKPRDTSRPIPGLSRDLNKIENDTRDMSKPNKPRDTNRPIPGLSRDLNKSIENDTRDTSKPTKPIVPKKPTRPETMKKPNSTTTNVENSAENLTSRDSVNKKRALIPPPKPKRLFLESKETENKMDGDSKELSSSELVNTQERFKNGGAVESPTTQKTGTPRKKPLPLPRKKV